MGAAIASAIVFLLVKKVGTRIVYLFVSREKMESLKFLNDEQKLGTPYFHSFSHSGSAEGRADLPCGTYPHKAL